MWVSGWASPPFHIYYDHISLPSTHLPLLILLFLLFLPVMTSLSSQLFSPFPKLSSTSVFSFSFSCGLFVLFSLSSTLHNFPHFLLVYFIVFHDLFPSFLRLRPSHFCFSSLFSFSSTFLDLPFLRVNFPFSGVFSSLTSFPFLNPFSPEFLTSPSYWSFFPSCNPYHPFLTFFDHRRLLVSFPSFLPFPSIFSNFLSLQSHGLFLLILSHPHTLTFLDFFFFLVFSIFSGIFSLLYSLILPFLPRSLPPGPFPSFPWSFPPLLSFLT